MAEEPKFVIDGTDYPIPELDDFTMGEALVLYEYTGLSIDEVGDESPRMPLVAAFMHIAYQRGNPDASEAKVKRLVRSANLASALEKFAVADEDDARPPELSPSDKPAKPLVSESDSGGGSTNGSTEPDIALSPTGMQDSPTPVT